jgi:hypothetical protein
MRASEPLGFCYQRPCEDPPSVWQKYSEICLHSFDRFGLWGRDRFARGAVTHG